MLDKMGSGGEAQFGAEVDEPNHHSNATATRTARKAHPGSIAETCPQDPADPLEQDEIDERLYSTDQLCGVGRGALVQRGQEEISWQLVLE